MRYNGHLNENETKNRDKEIVKLVGFLSFIISCIFFQCLYCASAGNKNNSHFLPEAQSLLASLQSAAAIYVAQQRMPPKVFSDYVVVSGEVKESKTLTLENLQGVLMKNGIKGLNTKVFTISFKPEGKQKATYYLKGTDITAKYEGF